MRIKALFIFFLVFGAIGQGKGVAQSITDSTQFRQAKLAIWCQSVNFIYQDHQADSLANRLSCQDWQAFRKSLEPNYLQVNSFFQTIEKPAIYAGYTSFDAKIQKLIDEIGRKLKSSPSRSQDQKRLSQVDSLQTVLLAVVAAPEASPSPIATQEQTVGNAREVEPASAQLGPVNETGPLSEEDEISWSEWLQWILLLFLLAVVSGLWIQNRKLKKELNARMLRRKQEIGAVSRVQESIKLKREKEPDGISKAEVIGLIKAEIDKIRQQQKMKRQQLVGADLAGNKGKPRPEQRKEKAVPVSVSSASASAVKELNQKESEKAASGLYYDKLPFKGGFHQNQLSSQRNPDSIYSIQVLAGKPDEAEFWVTEDREIQKYAMQNGLSFFEEACEYNQVEESPSRVRNLEKGRLRKSGHLWEIEKKVKVSFE